MPSPIEMMIDRTAMFCTVCNKPAGTCDCWERCRCGRSFLRGEKCPNPDHELEKACEELATGLAGQVILNIRHAYPEPMKHASGGFQRTLKALIQRHAKETLMDVYRAIDETKSTDTGNVT